MKFNIEINVADLFVEAEEKGQEIYFTDELRKAILYEARKQIQKLVDPIVGELVNTEFSKRITTVVEAMADHALETIHTTEQWQVRYATKTCEQVILDRMMHGRFEDQLSQHMSVKIKEHIATLTRRYDLAYAAGIVDGLNKHGLLNQQAANLLIEKQGE
jgi:hypothetical protein